LNIPFLTKRKTKYKVLLANDRAIFSNTLEYSEKGVTVGRTDSGYLFIPYDAILWIDYNADYTK